MADPIAASRISPNDAMRTQRALEGLYGTGEPISKLQGATPPPWRVLELGLDPPNLRERIAKRTAKIYANGLLEETKELILRYGTNLRLLQTIGYKEALQVIQGELELKEAITLTTLRTQQFAKRQRTWFRRKHNPTWLNDDEPLREALSLIQASLR